MPGISLHQHSGFRQGKQGKEGQRSTGDDGNVPKLATPGEPHKQLASLAGTWATHTKEWMEPGPPPTDSTGTCEYKVLLDGRFVQQECSGQMMGQSFTGIGTHGYDNFTKKYVTPWH